MKVEFSFVGRVVALGAMLAVLAPRAPFAQWQFGGQYIVQGNGDGTAFSDGAGNVIWVPLAGGDSQVTKLSPNGSVVWTRSVSALNPTAGNTGTVRQASADLNGGALIAWQYLDAITSGYAVRIQRVSATGQVQWGTGVTVAQTRDSGFRVVPDENGGAFVFSEARHPDTGIRWAHVDANGSVIAGPVSVSSLNAEYIEDARPDGLGGAIVIWRSIHSPDQSDLYAQRVDQDGNPLWIAGGAPVCEAVGIQSGSMMNEDGVGGTFVTWTDQRDPDAKVYSQHIDGLGVPSWQVDGNRISLSSGRQSEPHAIADGTGGIVVVWDDARFGLVDIYAQRVATTGDLLWSNSGALVCAAPSYQFFPRAVVSDSKVFVAWGDSRQVGAQTSSDIFFQVLDMNGLPLLELDGIQWSATFGTQGNVRLSVSASGPVVFWQDSGAYETFQGIYRPNGVYADGITDDYYLTWGLGAAKIQSSEDVRGDQGGRIALHWLPSPYDKRTGRSVTRYSVWRAVDGSVASNTSAPRDLADAQTDFETHGMRVEQTPTGPMYWEWLGDVDALAFEGYSFTAPTLIDSTSAGLAVHSFQIVTHSVDQFTYWKSEPATGYSVDNLAPATPRELAANYVPAPSSWLVHWRRNEEADLMHYKIYRGIGDDFVPSSANLISTTQDTVLVAASDLLDEPWHVKVSAVDVHGNTSGYALLRPLPPVSTFFSRSSAERADGLVRVKWETSQFVENVVFRIYRAVDRNEVSEIGVAVQASATRFWFEDHDVIPAASYRYRVVALTDDVEVGSFELTVGSVPLEFSLAQNHPNPFNPSTTIRFGLPTVSDVTLFIYDVSGRLVDKVVDGSLPAGRHTVEWDGRASDGAPVASGIYVYQLRSSGGVLARKMVLLK